MTRIGRVLKLRPEAEAAYKEYHAAVWPEVLELLRDCNVRNYSIYLWNGYLFSYFEYTGKDFAADNARIAAHPRMKDWWEIMEPMQQPVETAKAGEWWVDIEEVFHTD